MASRPRRYLRIIRSVSDSTQEFDLSPAESERLGLRAPADRSRPTIAYLMDAAVNWRPRSTPTTCPSCSTELRDIVVQRTIGCSECYRTFSDAIERMIGIESERSSHSGRIPAALEHYRRIILRRDHLRGQLEEALDEEDYENAADLRDQLNELSEEEFRSS